MKILIYTLHLLIPIAVGLTIYFWSSTFKKLSIIEIKDLDEDQRINIKEKKILNRIGLVVFVLIGFFVWITLGTTIGRIADLIAPNNLSKWIVFLLIYFVFLRIPFGITNKLIMKVYDFKSFKEKEIFAIAMITGFIVSICYYEVLPKILKWPLYFLN